MKLTKTQVCPQDLWPCLFAYVSMSVIVCPMNMVETQVNKVTLLNAIILLNTLIDTEEPMAEC
jgi:hypothetical protein